MLLRRLAEGAAIALVSDAGTPLISDPGFKLVRAAQEAGHAVTALPGASATLAALTVAGLPTDQFFFAGFLPPKASGAARAHCRTWPHSGDAGFVRDRAAACRNAGRSCGGAWPARGRGLPRAHQAARGSPPRRSCGAGAELSGNEPRGEIVLVVAPPPAAAQPSASETDTLLRAALARVSLKDAVGEVADVDRHAAARALSARTRCWRRKPIDAAPR